MGELAKRHSLRVEIREQGGRTRPLRRNNPLFGPHARRVACEAPVGVLQGPLQVRGGFSIFKVLDREEGIHPFGTVRQQVDAMVRTNAQDRAMGRFLESLREKYASRIKVYKHALERTRQHYAALEDSVQVQQVITP